MCTHTHLRESALREVEEDANLGTRDDKWFCREEICLGMSRYVCAQRKDDVADLHRVACHLDTDRNKYMPTFSLRFGTPAPY
jgi:hypothetical protein